MKHKMSQKQSSFAREKERDQLASRRVVSSAHSSIHCYLKREKERRRPRERRRSSTMNTWANRWSGERTRKSSKAIIYLWIESMLRKWDKTTKNSCLRRTQSMATLRLTQSDNAKDSPSSEPTWLLECMRDAQLDEFPTLLTPCMLTPLVSKLIARRIKHNPVSAGRRHSQGNRHRTVDADSLNALELRAVQNQSEAQITRRKCIWGVRYPAAVDRSVRFTKERVEREKRITGFSCWTYNI